jgi:hypothetical protein
MFEKQRLCGDGAYTTPAHEFRDGDEKVDGEHEQVAHEVNGTTPANACKTARFMWIGSYCEFATDSIFARHLDESIRALNLSVLKSPPRCPKANSICERVIGTMRRECLDWLIPMSEGHLRSVLKSWVEHYNRGRPHSSLGPGVPDPPDMLVRPKTGSPPSAGGGCYCALESGARWTAS